MHTCKDNLMDYLEIQSKLRKEKRCGSTLTSYKYMEVMGLFIGDKSWGAVLKPCCTTNRALNKGQNNINVKKMQIIGLNLVVVTFS